MKSSEKHEPQKIYAVIDTNVIVSALISKTLESNPVKVIRAITQERIVPLYCDEILAEYIDVLCRSKFNLDRSTIDRFMQAIVTDGLNLDRVHVDDLDFPDPEDVVFYEVALSKEDSYLVTGNIRHFPQESFIITPAEMVRLLER